MEKSHLYFAYGSNLNWDQMEERCSQPRFITVAYYPNHVLRFTKQSISEIWGKGSWLADMIFSPGDTVWGVIYEMPESDLANLDRIEDIRPDGEYLRQEIVVYNKEGERIIAWSYFVREKTGEGPPSEKYLGAILKGAEFHSLPEDYLCFLRTIKSISF